MNRSPISSLEEAFRQSGEGWFIDSFDSPNDAMDHIHQLLAAVQQRARERLNGKAPEFTDEALIREFHKHPSQVNGFFQAIGGECTPEMLLMVWRIIEGMEIKEVELTYHRKEMFQLRVILESSLGDEDPVYESIKIADFAVFRHIGMLEMNNLPILDGFYPLRVHGR